MKISAILRMMCQFGSLKGVTFYFMLAKRFKIEAKRVNVRQEVSIITYDKEGR